MKRVALTVFALFLIFSGILAAYTAFVPYKKAAGRQVFIPKGSSSTKIAEILEKASIIRSKLAFLVYVIATGKKGKLQWGEYAFLEPVGLHQVVTKLYRGEVKTYLLTLKEGETLYDLASSLEALGFFPAQKTCDQLRDKAFIRSLHSMIPSELDSLEGFLYPETYRIERRQGLAQIVRPMVQEFFKQVDTTLLAKAGLHGLNLKNLVTLGSIIERETPHPEEMPLIASVFHNRLRLGMPLQADPTAVYDLSPRYKGPVLPEHLKRPSPYNTYRIVGLPKGPICNPSKAALHAAANPANTPYLYFVAKKDGYHSFAKSYAEHLAHIRTLRKTSIP